jgi:hypothetical protein
MTAGLQFTPLYGAQADGPLCCVLRVGPATLLLDCGWDDTCSLEQLAPVLRCACVCLCLCRVWLMQAAAPAPAALMVPRCAAPHPPTTRSIAPMVDLVLLSQPDLRHSGALPYLRAKAGLGGPVYATSPVARLGPLFLYDLYTSKHVSMVVVLLGVSRAVYVLLCARLRARCGVWCGVVWCGVVWRQLRQQQTHGVACCFVCVCVCACACAMTIADSHTRVTRLSRRPGLHARRPDRYTKASPVTERTQPFAVALHTAGCGARMRLMRAYASAPPAPNTHAAPFTAQHSPTGRV